MIKWILTISFLLGILLFGVFYVFVTKDVKEGYVVPEDLSKQTIELNYSENSDVHRFTGEIKLPHSCYSLTNQVILDPVRQGEVTISFSTQDNTSSAKVCSQFVTGYLFDIVVEGPTVELNPTVFIDGNRMQAIVKKRSAAQFNFGP